MRRWKRVLSVGLTAALLAGMSSIAAYAASPVTSLSLEVESDIAVGAEYNIDDVSIMTKSDKYVIGDMEFTNDGYEWEATDTPVVRVYVEANDGYYLSVKAANIKVKGAEYIGGQKIDSKTMLLTLHLPSLAETIGEIESAKWDSATVASWTPAYNAGVYEVRLYKDGKTVKTTQTTTATNGDFSGMMFRAGTYSFKVRAVNKVKSDKKSEWVESGDTYIDEATAARNREAYGNVSTGLNGPDEVITSQVKDGWNQDGIGWWYRNPDGSYPKESWLLAGDKWYFFNSSGYMQTGWILWKGDYYYCEDTNGHMLTSTITPDGYRVDSAGIWIE